MDAEVTYGWWTSATTIQRSTVSSGIARNASTTPVLRAVTKLRYLPAMTVLIAMQRAPGAGERSEDFKGRRRIESVQIAR